MTRDFSLADFPVYGFVNQLFESQFVDGNKILPCKQFKQCHAGFPRQISSKIPIHDVQAVEITNSKRKIRWSEIFDSGKSKHKLARFVTEFIFIVNCSTRVTFSILPLYKSEKSESRLRSLEAEFLLLRTSMDLFTLRIKIYQFPLHSTLVSC